MGNKKFTSMREFEDHIEKNRREIEKRRIKEQEEFKKKWFNKKMLVIYAFAIIILGSFIKVNIPIPANVEVIFLEDYGEFVTEPCLNYDIESIDNVSYGTYKEAVENGYYPDSTCTETTVNPKQNLIEYYIMNKMFGIAEDPLSRWNENGEWKW